MPLFNQRKATERRRIKAKLLRRENTVYLEKYHFTVSHRMIDIPGDQAILEV